ncbi:nuclear localization sequence-binding protein-like [Dendronephthya gigantea]|uniref:nuclear localization sequence-binding protein-like n=1 Tax=Dendronephthya gigantea TaxID=151771 RepID=UPI00106D8B7E|nr:nuclear localization sequence-binding protein-like [Dendronephthya gigantea]
MPTSKDVDDSDRREERPKSSDSEVDARDDVLDNKQPSEEETEKLLEYERPKEANLPNLAEILQQVSSNMTRMDKRMDNFEAVVKGRRSRRRSSSSDSSSSRSSSSSGNERRHAKKRKRSKSEDRGSPSPSVDNDAEKLIQSASKDQPATGDTKRDSPEAQDDLLNDIANEFNADETLGSPLPTQLVDIVNKRWSEKMSDTKLKDKLDKYGRPPNCEKLAVPKVNPEIWGQ